MITFDVRIEGLSPYLMHRPTEEALSGEATRKVKTSDKTPREAAQETVYETDEGTFYFPGGAIFRLLREAASNHKQRGNRRSMKYVIPAAVIVPNEDVTLLNGAGPLKEWEVDSRPVTIPSTKGRVMRHRARFEEWAAEFSLEIDETLVDPEFVQQILTEGGRAIGIGDFRPEKGGPFGRFMLTGWKQSAD